MAAGRMRERPYALDETACGVVRDAIVVLCAERGWSLLALQVRTNHVQVWWQPTVSRAD